MDLLNAHRQVSSQQVQSIAVSLASFGCQLIRSPCFRSYRRDFNNTGSGMQLLLKCLDVAPWPCVCVFASPSSLVPMLTAKGHCQILRLMPLMPACAMPTVLLTLVFPAQAAAAAPGNPTAYVRKETHYAWDCIQKECQKVLAMLLQGQTGATAVSTQSDKLGQLACTISFVLHCLLFGNACPSIYITAKVCKPAVPSQDAFLTMAPGILHSQFAALQKQYRMHPMQSPLLHIVSRQRCSAQGG